MAGNLFTQAVDAQVTASISLPNRCNLPNCQLAENALAANAQSATCADDGNNGCDCTAVYDLSDTTAGTYTTDQGVATVDSGETYYYCVAGDTLQLREFGTTNDDAIPTLLYTRQ